MAKVLNLARVTSPTVGTGAISLGGAVEGFKTWADAGAAQNETYAYVARDGAQSEMGYSPYVSGVLTERNVRSSTNNNNPITLSGNAEVFSAPSASEFIDSNVADDVETQIALIAAVFN